MQGPDATVAVAGTHVHVLSSCGDWRTNDFPEPCVSDHDSQLKALSQERMRYAVVLTVTMIAIYFGFILLVAYNKPLMGSLLMPGLSLGILLGALVIVVTWILTWIYVRWANRVYDVRLAALKRSEGGPA